MNEQYLLESLKQREGKDDPEDINYWRNHLDEYAKELQGTKKMSKTPKDKLNQLVNSLKGHK